jgi:hypothetical protein
MPRAHLFLLVITNSVSSNQIEFLPCLAWDHLFLLVITNSVSSNQIEFLQDPWAQLGQPLVYDKNGVLIRMVS